MNAKLPNKGQPLQLQLSQSQAGFSQAIDGKTANRSVSVSITELKANRWLRLSYLRGEKKKKKTLRKEAGYKQKYEMYKVINTNSSCISSGLHCLFEKQHLISATLSITTRWHVSLKSHCRELWGNISRLQDANLKLTCILSPDRSWSFCSKNTCASHCTHFDFFQRARYLTLLMSHFTLGCTWETCPGASRHTGVFYRPIT